MLACILLYVVDDMYDLDSKAQKHGELSRYQAGNELGNWDSEEMGERCEAPQVIWPMRI